ncbi:MAG: LysM peptidoglycan-binding domain-containing protein [Acetatifactor sp.]|nr:LysM peptidoglycan-binding domain-containing protein [Acetatifactor sp.]
MDDFEIEISEVNNKNASPIQLPLNILNIGEIENDDVKVYIKQDVYKELEKYASSDTAHELGTIILGDYSEELGKMHVVISDFIYAKYTDASASTLTFTHKTWDYIHNELNTNYPDKKIVGWQHTHPGYGIFLSNYDIFIQENFFNVPFQVAYVIDPVQHLRGFFQWKNGTVERLKGFYIYDDLGKQIKIDQPKVKRTEGGAGPETVHSKVIVLLSVLTVCLAVSVFSLSRKYAVQISKQAVLENKIEEQNILLAQQAQEIALIKESVTWNSMQDTEMITDTKPESDIKEEVVKNETQQNVEETAAPNDAENGNDVYSEAPIEKEGVENQVMFKAYTVQAGDSLLAICKANNLDYAATYRIILSINGIEDADQIYVGQTILLPIYK